MAVNADVPSIDVHFLDFPDKEINELGARGIGAKSYRWSGRTSDHCNCPPSRRSSRPHCFANAMNVGMAAIGTSASINKSDCRNGVANVSA